MAFAAGCAPRRRSVGCWTTEPACGCCSVTGGVSLEYPSLRHGYETSLSFRPCSNPGSLITPGRSPGAQTPAASRALPQTAAAPLRLLVEAHSACCPTPLPRRWWGREPRPLAGLRLQSGAAPRRPRLRTCSWTPSAPSPSAQGFRPLCRMTCPLVVRVRGAGVPSSRGGRAAVRLASLGPEQDLLGDLGRSPGSQGSGSQHFSSQPLGGELVSLSFAEDRQKPSW